MCSELIAHKGLYSCVARKMLSSQHLQTCESPRKFLSIFVVFDSPSIFQKIGTLAVILFLAQMEEIQKK